MRNAIGFVISLPPLVLSDALRVCSDVLFHLGCAAAGAHPPKKDS